MLPEVTNDHEPILSHGIRANRNIGWDLVLLNPNLSLEPVAVSGHEADCGRGGLAHLGCNLDDIIEGCLRRSVENFEFLQSSEPDYFVPAGTLPLKVLVAIFEYMP